MVDSEMQDIILGTGANLDLTDEFVEKIATSIVNTIPQELSCDDKKMSIKINKSKEHDALYNIYVYYDNGNVDFTLSFDGCGQFVV